MLLGRNPLGPLLYSPNPIQNNKALISSSLLFAYFIFEMQGLYFFYTTFW